MVVWHGTFVPILCGCQGLFAAAVCVQHRATLRCNSIQQQMAEIAHGRDEQSKWQGNTRYRYVSTKKECSKE